jgi:hypothetical protein
VPSGCNVRGTGEALTRWRHPYTVFHEMFTALDFFAGSGLVRLGLEPEFQTLWANDICPKRRAVYVANNPPDEFHLGPIQDFHGADLPSADLAWASFPCQGLSLAGDVNGMNVGTRSGLFWEWTRVIQELGECHKLPPILVGKTWWVCGNKRQPKVTCDLFSL